MSQYPQGDPAYQRTPPAGQTNFERTMGDIGGSGPLSPQQERTWATLSHVVPLALFILSAGTLGFVASLVIYLMYKDRGPFVRQNAANSLNIQIAMGIGVVISWIMILTIILSPIGVLGLIAVAIWGCVLHALAAVKANNGEWYKPPMTPDFVK